MPYLDLVTNVKIDVKTFIPEFSKFSAETLGKPEQYISVSYTHNETLSFSGTLDPAFQLRVNNLGVNEAANEKQSAAFFKFFQEKLGAPSDRGYILFLDPGRANIGVRGTLASTLQKQ